MQDIVDSARKFAVKAHGSQTRKYEKLPYTVHLDRVVAILREEGVSNSNIIAAAFLHDVVEDTDYTIQNIVDEFGQHVAELVYWLTDAEKGTRQSAWRLGRAPFSAKLITLADLTDNTDSIVQHDPEFAKLFLREKAALLQQMAAREGERITRLPLFKRASANPLKVVDSSQRL